MMNRQLLRTLSPAARNQFGCSNVGSIHYYNSSRLASPLIANTIISNNTSPKTHHVNFIPSAPFSTDTDTNSPSPKKQVGIISRIRNALRTIFGSNDDTPRGIQEKKDMYWILLAVAHRQLRVEAQQRQQLSSSSSNTELMTWSNESKDQIKQYMNEAASYLDEQTDISEMSLRKLRQEVQSRLEPQIIQLLNVACDVEEDMILRHNIVDDDDDYKFSDAEATEYKEILLQEHDRLSKLLTNTNTSDATQYYKLKKDAIETLLQYFDWMPQHAPSTNEPKSQSDDEDYVDDFGFYPNRSEAETVSAIRYYHVRNIVRSHRVRTIPTVDTNTETNADTNKSMAHYTYSILPFRSTISNAGRGVFVDGFAPAGTLLSFFPGKVWPKEHLMAASLQVQMQFQNDPRNQLSMRYDDILIDSRQSPYTVMKNLWAAGHIVNHPPPPIKSTEDGSKDGQSKDTDEWSKAAYHFQPRQGPNCVTVPINFTEGIFTDQNDKLREYIPNEYELQPKSWAKDVFDNETVVMHGMGLIALRDVKDEELFYDYRMSPDENAQGLEGAYPSWYHVWDADSATNRWSTEDA